MKTILKTRWIVLGIWVVATIVLTLFTPNLDKIINDRGNKLIDQKYPSRVAQQLLDDMSDSKGSTGLLVFYNKDKLTDEDNTAIKTAVTSLKTNSAKLGITGTVNCFDTPEAKDQMVSKDGTTMLVSITYQKNDRDIKDIVNDIEAELKSTNVEHYLTGGEFISNDFLKATNAGVSKSAILTILFILVVLVIMFRSAVVPLMSLISVGIAYLTSMGIVGQLIAQFGFPVTSLTRMFLILILFGIGTDYNILLYNRFKEELTKQKTVNDAILVTYKTAGKTILYSATTIFFAFASLIFVKFGIYRSGVAVAVGIVVLVIELMTLTPVFFKLLGEKMFWPSKNKEGHKQSKIWEKVTSISVKRPYIAMLAIILLILPIIAVNSYHLSFDNLKDMGNDSPSVKGFNIVSDHFSKGKSMPTTVVIKSDAAMDNNKYLSIIDDLTNKLKKVEGVKSVAGPTQPKGEEISDFYTGNQTDKIADGLDSASDGLDKVSGGTGDLKTGLQKVNDGLKQIKSGIDKGAGGANDIAAGIKTVKDNLTLIHTKTEEVSSGYNQLQAGFTTFGDNYKQIEQKLTALGQLAGGANQTATAIASNPNYAALKQDPNYQGLLQMLGQLSGGIPQLDTGFKQLNTEYDKTVKSFQDANAGLKQLSDGEQAIINGLSALESGATALGGGLQQGADGQQTIITNMNTVISGVSQSADGLDKLSGGIDTANDFLKQLTGVKTFYLPDEALSSADFKKSLDAYLSDDRKTVKLTVTLNDDPYSDNAIKAVTGINEQVASTLKGTALAKATYATGGESSTTNDLHDVATSDMATTQMIVIIGVFIVLVLIIKSFWIPVYIIGSLLLSFYSAISITSLFTKYVIHSSEIAWNVPFFSFVMIVALGVDYSIFLMMRYKEYRHISPHEGIIKASSNIGGVIISAGIILAGTFITLYPSGIKTLMELAICVCTGILLLILILIPLAIPSFMSIQDFLVKKYAYHPSEPEPETDET